MTKHASSRFADDLPPPPLLAQVLGTLMRTALDAKAVFDRGVETALAILNLPSRADVQRLQTKLEVLQGTLTNLSMKVDRLLDAERRATTGRTDDAPTP